MAVPILDVDTRPESCRGSPAARRPFRVRYSAITPSSAG
jgi:hypothetical protein